LHKQLQRGVIVLACNLALRDCVELVKSRSGLNDEDARKEAIAALVPGVILQPSGVFAAVRAQEAGCSYVKAS
jgi:intracellular sulfur oxidation DsrE/DsrF family protein